MVTAGRCLIPARLSVGAEKAISGIADKQAKMAVSDYANLHLGHLGAWCGELRTGECHAHHERDSLAGCVWTGLEARLGAGTQDCQCQWNLRARV